MPTVAWPRRSEMTFGMHAGLQRHRRIRMPEIVQTNVRQTGGNNQTR